MKFQPGTPLSISLDWHKEKQPYPVGRLATDSGVAQLEWSQNVIADKLSVAALYYPPETGLQAARSHDFDGLHGFLADSLPEGWGYLLMRKRLARLGMDIATLTSLERLALVGNHGRGALVFAPATTPALEVESLDLDALAQEATALLTGEEGHLAVTLADLAGGSGGARPKIHVGFDGKGAISVGEGEVAAGHSAWLVKFRAPQDFLDIGPIEEAYGAMAQAAGLEMSEHRIIPAKSGPGYFATRRFDRPDGGGRLHMVSLAGAIEAPNNVPSASYDTFLRATRAITRHSDDVLQAFRRMVFNVLAYNRDDHTRQQSYLMSPGGIWRLAPAYDLTFAPGPGGEHYMDIEGEGLKPTRRHVKSLGKKHGFDEKKVDTVIDEVRAAVLQWSRFANEAGVTLESRSTIIDALSRVDGDFIDT